ncbi:hypothetical protein LQ567_04310 [Niabella pedocola]|uniref:DUF7674 domain-containing protein n=1 Tax=Niabella pedocola TaxID=1752077 RepID=A0ABS8PQ71_9BACT|nr:hypothetical protein [Niabella pedocola]MCD2421971.1 hypothetical protein [Niabella pedocola]
MNQYEIPAMIEDELPAIVHELETTRQFGNALQIMQVLVRFVKRMLTAHNLPVVIKCMRMVDAIYEKGDHIVKNAIENVFILSFSGLQKKCSMAEWRLLSTKIPIILYSVYIQQLYKPGI